MIPFWTLFYKEIIRIKRIIGQTIFSHMVTSGLYLMIFGLSLGNRLQMVPGYTYLEFLLPGLIMMGVINSSFMNPSFSLMLSRVYGDIEDLRTSPIRTNAIIWAMTFAGTVRGLLVAIVTLFIGEIFSYLQNQTFIIPEHFTTLVVFLILGGLSFSLFGLSIGLISKNWELLNVLSQFILLPLIYLGGVFYSLDTLNPIWSYIARFNPVFYYINAVRYGFLGKTDVSIGLTFGIVLFFFALFYLLAIWTAKRASFKHF